MHTTRRLNGDILAATTARAARDGVPVWCPWPMPPGWMMTGLAWVGDDRGSLSATAIACSGPAPLGSGPADMLLVCEEPGVGLGNRLAGLDGADPGVHIARSDNDDHGPHAKVKAAGHPTPLWSVQAAPDRSVYVGEAKGRWLFAVSWPAVAGYLFADSPVLHDLADWLPTELVFGAPSPRLPTND